MGRLSSPLAFPLGGDAGGPLGGNQIAQQQPGGYFGSKLVGSQRVGVHGKMQKLTGKGVPPIAKRKDFRTYLAMRHGVKSKGERQR